MLNASLNPHFRSAMEEMRLLTPYSRQWLLRFSAEQSPRLTVYDDYRHMYSHAFETDPVLPSPENLTFRLLVSS